MFLVCTTLISLDYAWHGWTSFGEETKHVFPNYSSMENVVRGTRRRDANKSHALVPFFIGTQGGSLWRRHLWRNCRRSFYLGLCANMLKWLCWCGSIFRVEWGRGSGSKRHQTPWKKLPRTCLHHRQFLFETTDSSKQTIRGTYQHTMALNFNLQSLPFSS